MNILFWIEPLIMHNRPFHYWAWLDYASRMQRTFQAAGSVEFRFAMNEALILRATAPYERTPRFRPRRGQGLPAASIVSFAQEEIRGIFDAPSREILSGLHQGTGPGDRLDRMARLVRERLGAFEPDVIFAWTPVPFLRRAYPDAVVFGVECGPFSRRPYPSTLFYDPLGIWEYSVPSVHAEALKRRRPEPAEAHLLAAMREHYGPWFHEASPYHGLEQRMRSRCRALALLPLQFAGESGFDLNAPFGNQGEYLFHVLERLPQGLGLLVVEHPTALWVGDAIDEETREYVEERYPHVVFVDYRSADSAGQFLIHHVDAVISVSSSLGLQAIFWQKPLIALGRSQLRPYSAFEGIAAIDLDRLAPLDGLDGAMAWLLTRYYADCRYALEDPEWILRFIGACREARPGLDLLPPVAPIEDLERILCMPLPEIPQHVSTVGEGILYNANFSVWSEGPGPFRTRGITADGWELVPGEGHAAQVRRSDAGGVRLERRKASTTPILLLQRIPDVRALSGAFVIVRFRARSATEEPLQIYLYQQFDTGRIPPRGTEMRQVHPGPAWRTFTYETLVPLVEGGAEPGPGSHTELVFGLLAADTPGDVEIADVELT